MENLIGVVQAVCVGTTRPYRRPGTTSAISKYAVREEVNVYFDGIEGDEQADLRVHGGVDKAVHIFPFEHYVTLQSCFSAQPGRFLSHGSFGENLSTVGVNEANICIGDLLAIGNVILEVTQPRQPCWKVSDKFGIPALAEVMQQQMTTGFYCRVLQPGTLAGGHSIALAKRCHPQWPLTRLLSLLYQIPLNPVELQAARQLPLPSKWKAMFERRLLTNRVEDWTARLRGPENHDFTL